MQVIQTRTLRDTTLSWGKLLAAVATVVAITVGMVGAANAQQVVSGCSFDDTVPGTWSLEGDCTTTGPINVPAGTTVEGNDFTISGGYTFGSNGAGTNTVIGVIGADNVTINDLTVDGTNGTNLHGINVYDSTGVVLNDVTIKNNDKSGLGVNSSAVTVNNLTTAGNGWHGVNVDQRTADPSSLTINGVSSHNELLQVYVDDTTKLVSVVDTNNQYDVTNPQVAGRVNDANYVLKPIVVEPTKDTCKNGGYAAFGFKNQGQCVASVVASEKASFKRN
jgi:hypothetical protein